jgi:hypothetical protein
MITILDGMDDAPADRSRVARDLVSALRGINRLDRGGAAAENG